MTTLHTVAVPTLNHLSIPSHDAAATADFFARYLVCEVLPMGSSRVLKKDGLDIVIEHAPERDLRWPQNFHMGAELPTLEDLVALRERMLADKVPMETELFAHARGSRFFCRMPGGVLLEVNTRADAEPAYRATFASQQG